jgi:hypothetical protein
MRKTRRCAREWLRNAAELRGRCSVGSTMAAASDSRTSCLLRRVIGMQLPALAWMNADWVKGRETNFLLPRGQSATTPSVARYLASSGFIETRMSCCEMCTWMRLLETRVTDREPRDRAAERSARYRLAPTSSRRRCMGGRVGRYRSPASACYQSNPSSGSSGRSMDSLAGESVMPYEMDPLLETD